MAISFQLFMKLTNFKQKTIWLEKEGRYDKNTLQTFSIQNKPSKCYIIDQNNKYILSRVPRYFLQRRKQVSCFKMHNDP